MPENAGYIGFNSFSGSIIELTASEMECYKAERIDMSCDFWNQLKGQGFIVSDENSQLEMVKGSRKAFASDSKGLFFRILPTTRCNARCPYCYEDGIAYLDMNESIISDIVSFIDSCCVAGVTEKIGIQFYGGEPLLKIDIVQKIAESIQKHFRKTGIKVYFSMISNGILIDESNIKILSDKICIKRIQITLDGFGKEYTKTKNYIIGYDDPFERIIKNIHLCLDNKIYVDVRLNISGDNFNSMVKLIEYLSDEYVDHTFLNVYAHPIYGKEWPNENPPDSSYITPIKLSTIIKKLYKHSLIRLPAFRRKKGLCGAVHPLSFMIQPDGKLLKCMANTTDVVGSVQSGIMDNDAYKKWCDYELSETCGNCPYLPICQGGCKAGWLGELPVSCFVYKNVMGDMLLLLTEKKD